MRHKARGTMGSSDVPYGPDDGEDDPFRSEDLEDLLRDIREEDETSDASEPGDDSVDGWGWATDGENDEWPDEDEWDDEEERSDEDERREGSSVEEAPSPGETGEPRVAPETGETPDLGETADPEEMAATRGAEPPEATRWWGQGFMPAMGETERVVLEEKLWSLDHVDISEA